MKNLLTTRFLLDKVIGVMTRATRLVATPTCLHDLLAKVSRSHLQLGGCSRKASALATAPGLFTFRLPPIVVDIQFSIPDNAFERAD